MPRDLTGFMVTVKLSAYDNTIRGRVLADYWSNKHRVLEVSTDEGLIITTASALV